MSDSGPRPSVIAAALRKVTLASAFGLLILTLLAMPSTARALSAEKAFHNFIRDSWSVEQGLPHIAALAVAQDAEGYIWVGTPNGLAQFDGVRFTTFTAATTPALPSDTIQALQMDRDGRLWIGTSKGLAWYRDGMFTAIRTAPGTPVDSASIQNLLAPRTGELLIATDGGLSKVVDGVLMPDRRVSGPIHALIGVDDDRWLGSVGGVFRLRNAGEVRFEALPGLAATDTVQHLAASSGLLWAGTTSGLFVRGSDGWQRYSEQSTLARADIGVLHQDKDGNLWVGTQSGLTRLRDGVIVEQVDNDRMGTRWDYLTAFEDRESNLWLGSRARGLTRLWSGLTTRYSVQEGLKAPQVWAIERDGGSSGRILVGTDDGLSELVDGRYNALLAGNLLPDPNVFSLLIEGDDVWIGTLKGARLLRRGQLEPLPALNGLDGLRINGILRDRARRLWFATSNGLYRYTGGVLTRYGKAEGLSDTSVRVLYQTRDGRLLLGTQAGLGEWATGKVTMLSDDSNGLPRDIDVTAIHELPDQRLVIGTATEELHIGEGKRWTAFGHGQGLPQNTPFSLFDDARGYLWVAGLRGLYRAPIDDFRRGPDGQPKPARVEVYGNEFAVRSTGPRGECCNGVGNSKGFLERGSLWLPTRDGVLVVPTEALASNKVPPTVRIESVNADDTWMSVGRFLESTLPARVRDLSFKFSALSFQDPYAVQLQYRLRGYDEGWRPVKDLQSRYADYTNLPPGDYVFEVRGANNAGVWSETPASVRFAITPRLHETTWFYGAVGLLLLLIAFAAHRWQLRALNNRRAVLENIVAQRTDALALANQQLEKASYTDPLTGLRNRRYLLNQLPQDLAFYRRKGAESYDPDHILLFLLVDIDHFKRINDSHGHSGGDLVLQQFSNLLGELVRIGDYVTRWGGEEFLIVSRPLSRAHAISYASRICTVVSAHPFDAGGTAPLQLSCSIGFSEYPLHATPPTLDWQDLVELADRALYHVKETGRDGWASFQFTSTTPFPALIQRFKRDRDGLLAEDALRLLTSRDPLPPDSQAVAVEFKARS
ncbi:ligand-binding sensor domain-containing diguanylate cyclase [Nevskia sp.]|uniref:ligand-binding sensor domain-containing diguanylate cyclase n=1 Tax=Nevskia sp. TaxID=1929292 RepID=UPI0025D79186|nr:ligand-binding sensor domain-containing diguanylate cyclase [Nevskia sp.]